MLQKLNNHLLTVNRIQDKGEYIEELTRYYVKVNLHMWSISRAITGYLNKRIIFFSQCSRLLLWARESPLSTSEPLETSFLLREDDVERDTMESISIAVST